MSDRISVRPVVGSTEWEVSLDGEPAWGQGSHRDACMFAAELRARLATIPAIAATAAALAVIAHDDEPDAEQGP